MNNKKIYVYIHTYIFEIIIVGTFDSAGTIKDFRTVPNDGS